jgi:hypothetical protein
MFPHQGNLRYLPRPCRHRVAGAYCSRRRNRSGALSRRREWSPVRTAADRRRANRDLIERFDRTTRQRRTSALRYPPRRHRSARLALEAEDESRSLNRQSVSVTGKGSFRRTFYLQAREVCGGPRPTDIAEVPRLARAQYDADDP